MKWIELDPENPPKDFVLFARFKNGVLRERDILPGYFRTGSPGTYYGMGIHNWVINPTHYAIINVPE